MNDEARLRPLLGAAGIAVVVALALHVLSWPPAWLLGWFLGAPVVIYTVGIWRRRTIAIAAETGRVTPGGALRLATGLAVAGFLVAVVHIGRFAWEVS